MKKIHTKRKVYSPIHTTDDVEMTRQRLRPPKLHIDQSVFVKSPEDKEAIKHHKQFCRS